ncbi:uncharacterized protein LOC108677723 [Hyalella azteca]|uniref:Uncharacterized protein LOC108677723 n=1 Tax=Hyalella azteca TaxID=294128 RepID=A0A979FTQ6_HYAAZ|nr:uncharacterized protein LOC108677723 [Hyalella azteca]
MCYFVGVLVGNASIVDFGAGLGQYGMCFLRKSQAEYRLDDKQQKEYIADIKNDLHDIQKKPQIVYSWHGYDGGFAIEEVSGGFIAHADLSEEGLWLGRKWDWVMSIEVGEHIDPKHEGHFLDNLVRHACAGMPHEAIEEMAFMFRIDVLPNLGAPHPVPLPAEPEALLAEVGVRDEAAAHLLDGEAPVIAFIREK